MWFSVAVVLCFVPHAVVQASENRKPLLRSNGKPCLTLAATEIAPGIQPCPCLSEEVRKREVNSVVRNAEVVGVKNVAQTANQTATLWVAKIHAAAQKARNALDKIRWGEVDATRNAIETEKQSETSVAWQMREAILAANAELDATAMTAASEEWARNQAMNEIVNLTNATMMQLSLEEEKAETLRLNASSEEQSLLAAAKEMAQTAAAAESLAWDLKEHDPEHFVTAVEAEDRKALTQVELSRQLSAKASKAGEEANVLASSALARAKAAELGAAKALATAQTNTQRIARLKARVQKAQQRAMSAAGSAVAQLNR